MTTLTQTGFDFTDRPPLRIASPKLERAIDLTAYDVILINTSAGKDSQSMMDALVVEATRQGVKDRLVAVHADLGRVEWQGTLELAQKQADHYGVRLIVCKRTQNDLLGHIRAKHAANLAKGKVQPPMPSPTIRDCTSDHKRGPIRTVMTALVRELGLSGRKTRKARILNCIGIRGQEGDKRSKMAPFSVSPVGDASTQTTREVTDWYPIFNWSVEDVWATIKASGCPHHPAYDLGMPRLSCVFCIFSQRPELLIAGRHNPELLADYVELERETGYTFQTGGVALADIQAELASE